MVRKIKRILILMTAASLLSMNIYAIKTYTDAQTGITFTVPDGWSEMQIPSDKDYSDFYDIAYISDDQCAIIGFVCQDVWSDLSARERNGLTRAEMETNLLSEEDEQFLMGDVEYIKADYNGRTYYKYEVTQETSYDFGTITTHSEVYQYIDYGYAFCFAYLWYEELGNVHFGEFESMLGRVDYSPVDKLTHQSEKTATTTQQANNGIQKTDSNPAVQDVVGSKIFDADLGFYIMYFFTGALVRNWAIIVFGIIGLLKARKGKNPTGMIILGVGLTAFQWLGLVSGLMRNPKIWAQSLDMDIVSLICFVVILGVLIPLAIKRYKNSASGMTQSEPLNEQNLASPDVIDVPETAVAFSGADHVQNHETESGAGEQQARFCHKCGARLREESRFCAVCGAEIPKLEQ